MKLVDMAYTKAELKEEQNETRMGEASPYPWGLCLSLEKSQLDKLGIKDLPGVGDEWHLVAVAKVTSVNQSAREGSDEESRVGLQITMMQVALQALRLLPYLHHPRHTSPLSLSKMQVICL